MTSETYTALADCARRRIEQEWTCTPAERAVLQLIAELSFGLNQTWAYVPGLADFAAVLQVNKSTVSRALRAALKKGYVEVLKRRDETLYTLCTQTRGEASHGAQGAETATAARARLVQLNQARCQGQADPDGQQRLPGVLPSEEIGAPAAAFAAILEEVAESAESATPAPMDATRSVISTGNAEEPDEDFKARLERLTREEMARESGGCSAPAAALAPEAHVSPDPPPLRSQGAIFDEAMEKLSRGLKGEPLHVLQQVRAECQTGGNLQEAAFFNWGYAWRKRAVKFTASLREAVGEHKNLRMTQRGKGADEPGAYIYRRMTDFVNTS